MEDEEWKLLDWKTLTLIRLYLTKNVAFNTSKETITSCLMGYHERTWLSQAKIQCKNSVLDLQTRTCKEELSKPEEE